MDSQRTDLVVVGLGYVGLPLVKGAVDAGLRVVGFDVDRRKLEGLNAGRSHVDDISDAQVAELIERGFRATDDAEVFGRTDTIVICVPTPLECDQTPDLSAVRGAAATIAGQLRPGALVVLESTTYPGTTEEILAPLLEEGSGLRAGRDFHLAFSPERIDPGNPTWGLRNTPKIVGGLTATSTKAAVIFYERFIDTVVPVKGLAEAEMAKLLENTYRHINIALVNEMAIFCDELGVDLWESIDAAATKPFGFQAFRPGPGVGGHCIPIDPNYLSYRVRSLGYPFRFVELAQEVNNRMPAYVVTRAQRMLNAHRKPLNGSRVLLLGVTYKPDIADERESPARPLGRRLLEGGAELSYHDPAVATWTVGDRTLTSVPDPVAAAAEADLVVLVQPHRAYDLDALVAASPLLLDTRGVTDGERVERL
jgi:nucleotide sugar dehydrogenase